MTHPSYVALARSGELHRRADALEAMLGACNICPLDCGNNRLAGEVARCYAGALPIVSSHCAHFGEEPALVGTRGIGNIFFGNCNLRCVYCQNYQISQRWREERKNEVSVERLAGMMLELQNEKGCHSVGFVSPTHFTPQIVRAVAIAAERGLRVPLVYNTNGYDSVAVLKLLDGVIDIYLPDFKYATAKAGMDYSRVPDYPEHAIAALVEMHRQTGDELALGDDGLVRGGLIIRHLVLPNDVADSARTFEIIRAAIGNRATISLMAQYYPTNRVDDAHAGSDDRLMLINRRIRASEYVRALELLEAHGFENGWAQEFDAEEYYRPDFADRAEPFRDRRDFPAVPSSAHSS
jgi:putative pyruvate formate lyase activating enzyme